MRGYYAILKSSGNTDSNLQAGKALLLLEDLYQKYHNRQFLDPDPLSQVLEFTDARDREVAALVSALYSLGRVDLILQHLASLFSRLREPYRMLRDAEGSPAYKELVPSVYRFFSLDRSTDLLQAMGSVLKDLGSFEAAAASGKPPGGPSTEEKVELQGPFGALYALDNLCLAIRSRLADGNARIPGIIFPRINRKNLAAGGAAKRPLMFLRWMVRQDSVDPGGWELLSPRQLFYPLDTHIMSLTDAMDISHRRSAGMASVFEITSYFRKLCPHDPVRYDFSLARLGIHPDLSKEEFITIFRSEVSGINNL